MNRSAFILCLVTLSMAMTGHSDESDDTLKFYLSKSTLVVIGKITTESIGTIEELGVQNYLCSFKVDDVLKGDPKLQGQVIEVDIMRFEMHEKDKLPLIKRDVECILFLKNTAPDIPWWVTSDFWFGVQHPSPWMADSLKRLAKDQ